MAMIFFVFLIPGVSGEFSEKKISRYLNFH